MFAWNNQLRGLRNEMIMHKNGSILLEIPLGWLY